MHQERIEPSPTLWARGGKRVADVVGAVLGLIVFAPVVLAAAVAIKLTSRGPVLFSQVRVGRRGQTFRLLKLRTMRGDRTPDPLEIVTLAHPEITTVGRFLRRYKIDEIPQLLNVLAGQMSLIGPRPTLCDQVARYDDFKRQRLWVRPGITGLAQVHGSTAIDWDERIRFDVFYVAHTGLRLDLWILWRTALVIPLGEARFARGFDESARDLARMTS